MVRLASTTAAALSMLLLTLPLVSEEAGEGADDGAAWNEEPYMGEVAAAVAWLDNSTVAIGCTEGIVLCGTDGRHRVLPAKGSPTRLGSLCPDPDGDMVACLLDTPGGRRGVVITTNDGDVVEIDGGSPRVAWDAWGAWSSAGSMFCYSSEVEASASERTAFRIWLMDMTTGDSTPVTSSGSWIDACPSVTADETALIFSRTYHNLPCEDAMSPRGPLNEARVMALDLATREEHALTEGTVDRRPTVSANGDHIAFFRLDSRVGVALWLIERDTGTSWPLVGHETLPLSTHGSVQWTSSGSAVYVVSQGSVYRIPIGKGSLARMDLSDAVERVFAVSPDDSHIAYLTDSGYRIEDVKYVQ